MEFDDIRPSSVNSVNEVGIEVKDMELKKLSEYFEKSRAEIQKKVDSLLSLEATLAPLGPQGLNKEDSVVSAKQTQNSLKSRVASAISSTSTSSMASPSAIPIDLETACSLRELTTGSCVHALSNEWKRARFLFRKEEDLAFGLSCDKNGSKGFILSVQTVILKNLIRGGYKDIHGNEVKDSEWRNQRKILKPNETERKEVLIRSLVEILWQAGEKTAPCVVHVTDRSCFEIPARAPDRKSSYYGDGITERLHLYYFNSLKHLEEYIRKNLAVFQKENGCLIFLYSLILSRGLEKLMDDLQGNQLISDMEECKLGLFNLVMNGEAMPYFHNGHLYYDSHGQALEKAQRGLKARSDIGILYWNSNEEDDKRTEVGSTLKTPRFPIWLCMFGKNSLAILFGTNLDLTNNWRLEQYFALYFYSGLKKQEKSYKIEIDNRNIKDSVPDPIKNFKLKHPNVFMFEEDKEPEIISLIRTKWPECELPNIDGKELMNLV